MDLSVEIDRGDVWYDFPFDAGRQPAPAARALPQLTLFVKWRGERVPLVRWRTTVGGWRAELAADGQEYFRYKGSDVGPRVWRHIVAAPVWIPPLGSPLGSMVKEKRVNGTYVRSPTTTRPAPAICRPTAWSPPSTRRCGEGPTVRRLLRQRHPHPRLVRLPVAARPLLARLPPPLQPAGDAPVQLRARAPARARHWADRAGISARRSVERRGVRDAAAEPRLLLRAGSAPPGRRPRRADQGDAEKANRRLRPQAGGQVPSSSARRAPSSPETRPGAIRHEAGFVGLVVRLSPGSSRARRRAGGTRLPSARRRRDAAPRPRRPPRRRRRSPTAPPGPRRRSRSRPGGARAGPVRIRLVADANRKAHVFWGRKDLGVAPLEIRPPARERPLDLTVAGAPVPAAAHPRLHGSRRDPIAPALRRDDASGLPGYSSPTLFPHWWRQTAASILKQPHRRLLFTSKLASFHPQCRQIFPRKRRARTWASRCRSPI